MGVAVLLLRRSVAGQVLTDREQKILKRTFTDLASVIPIGFLMLLPVRRHDCRPTTWLLFFSFLYHCNETAYALVDSKDSLLLLISSPQHDSF